MSSIDQIESTASPTALVERHDLGTPRDWRDRLPRIAGAGFVLRELARTDAPMLLAALHAEEVSRFVDAIPTTVEEFHQFIVATRRERRDGRAVCFGIVPDGMNAAVGLVDIRAMQPDFGVAQWRFALASSEWGTGMFINAARKAVDFAVDVLGTYRLEARATVGNGRGNGALRKIGAVQETILRCGFERDGRRHDQMLWSITDRDWRLQRLARQPARLVS